MARNQRCWKPDIWVEYENKHYRRKIFKYLGWIHSKPMGNKVIRSILEYTKIIYHYKLTIRETKGLTVYFDDKRRIQFNLNLAPNEPTFNLIKARGALFVYLYHELVHAYRSGRGEYKTQSARDTLSDKICIEEEYPTTGLFEYADYPESENAFRKTIGLPRRNCYVTQGPTLPKETQRRYFLMLPLIGHNPFELQHTPGSGYKHKINKAHLNLYIAKYYNQEKKQWPKGFPRNLKPEDTKRKNGYGPPLSLPKL